MRLVRQIPFMHIKFSSERKRGIYMNEDFVLDVVAPIRKTPGGL